jgi:hypothetical protein
MLFRINKAVCLLAGAKLADALQTQDFVTQSLMT